MSEVELLCHMSDRCCCCAAVPPPKTMTVIICFPSNTQSRFSSLAFIAITACRRNISTPGGPDPAPLIQVHSNPAGGVSQRAPPRRSACLPVSLPVCLSLYLSVCLSVAKLADKPRHVAGERPGPRLATGLPMPPHNAFPPTRCLKPHKVRRIADASHYTRCITAADASMSGSALVAALQQETASSRA